MQLSRNDILQKLKEILLSADSRNEALLEKFDESADLYTDLGLTSIGMLYMVIAIEETFGIRFDDVGMSDFTILKDVVDYVEGKQA